MLEVVCGIDTNYAPHLGVMLRSLQQSNSDQKIRVHVLHDGISTDLQRRVEQCSPAITVAWIGVNDKRVLGLDGVLEHISRATYLRLLMVDLLPSTIKRVLYLDVDLIVDGGLRSLWQTDLEGKICAAVVDPGSDPDVFAKRWNLSGPGFYFNAGVVLFDLEKLRETPLLHRAIEILEDPRNICEFADQDALNVVLWNNCLQVDPGWNFQRKFLYHKGAAWKALNPVQRRPVIVHYTEAFKPWRSTEWHPCGWLYIRCLLRTSFRRHVLHAGQIGTLDVLKSMLRWLLKRPPMFWLPKCDI